jgi:S-adenosylmethionine:tRNA ribosyltransferase-isomerase
LPEEPIPQPTDDFDYSLPAKFIAQRPAEPRDSSRLLILDRKTGRIQHRIFRQIIEFLSPGDALVLNRTKVIPARLHARKIPTGGAFEVLLLKRNSEKIWEALVGGSGLRVGQLLAIDGGPKGEIIADLGHACRLIRFERSIDRELDQIGEMPLPPYIHTPLRNPEEYQTVFARIPGSAAAPTAGLHFTAGLLHSIRQKGVRIVEITLHVGLDTFAPVTEKDPRQHAIHREWYQINRKAANTLQRTHAEGGRIIAVGTTTVRGLETAARDAQGQEWLGPVSGYTDLFILPGHRFRVVDAVLTNFHLPRSTLLMMVSAFAGRERLLRAYQEAMQLGYRFYSFGDAMLIL